MNPRLWPGTQGDHAGSRDAGYSFVETVVAIVLMGTVILGILTAVRTSVQASSVAFESAQTETVLKNAADWVQRAEQMCDYDEYVEAAAEAADWEPSLAASSSELLNRGGATWEPDCSNVSSSDVQRVTISVTSPNRGITRSLMVVKSNVD